MIYIGKLLTLYSVPLWEHIFSTASEMSISEFCQWTFRITSSKTFSSSTRAKTLLGSQHQIWDCEGRCVWGLRTADLLVAAARQQVWAAAAAGDGRSREGDTLLAFSLVVTRAYVTVGLPSLSNLGHTDTELQHPRTLHTRTRLQCKWCKSGDNACMKSHLPGLSKRSLAGWKTRRKGDIE